MVVDIMSTAATACVRMFCFDKLGICFSNFYAEDRKNVWASSAILVSFSIMRFCCLFKMDGSLFGLFHHNIWLLS